MIKSTSSTSISGVTLIYGTALSPPPPPLIPIILLLCKMSPRGSPGFYLGRCRCGLRYCGSALLLSRDEPDLINPGLSNDIDDLDHAAVLDADAAFDVDDALGLRLALHHLVYARAQVFFGGLFFCGVVLAVAR